ncbi:MAG: diaminopimelate epimerase [Gammaproteobacteria bacterium]|nr:diaminopimelate epimerase [Gammaproteobacteria bacterium]
MMKTLPFYKYAANGNNFVIIDETEQPLVAEAKKSLLATTVCNPATGVGCDTLIFIQCYPEHALLNLSVNGDIRPDYIMRVFEQNGFESDCCGNGLLCLGHHLANSRAIDHAAIATEVPCGHAQVRRVKKIGVNQFQVAMGQATLPDSRLINLSAVSHSKINNSYYRLDNVAAFDHCYFTHTGTPHVVIFIDAKTELGKQLFNNNTDYDKTIIEKIGWQFNRLDTIFPLGSNVNIATVINNDHIAYRCFERGVYRETYACGTGAMAVAALAQQLNSCQTERLTILPWHARSHKFYQHAEIIITQQQGHYSLSSQTHLFAQGSLYTSRGMKLRGCIKTLKFTG